MKKFIFIIVFISVYSYSQQMRLSFDIGANHSWIEYDDEFLREYMQAVFKPKLNGGVSLGMDVLDYFNFSVGVKYLYIGRNDEFNTKIDENIYVEGEVNVDHHYLSFPLQIEFDPDILGFYIFSKLNFDYLLKLESRIYQKLYENNSLSDTYDTGQIEHTDEMNKLNIAIGIGIGYKFQIFAQNFRVKFSYTHGLTRVPKESEDETPGWMGWKTRDLNLSLQYDVNL